MAEVLLIGTVPVDLDEDRHGYGDWYPLGIKHGNFKIRFTYCFHGKINLVYYFVLS